MRKAAETLLDGPQLRRDVFVRGDPQAIQIIHSGRIDGDLMSLMSAYVNQRKREADRHYTPTVPQAYSIEDAVSACAGCCRN